MSSLLYLLSLYVRGETTENSWLGSKCVGRNRKVAPLITAYCKKTTIGVLFLLAASVPLVEVLVVICVWDVLLKTPDI